MKPIDLSTWDRRESYAYYRTFAQPKYNLTFSLDVTHFYDRIKRENRSFYLSFIHFILEIMNRHERFKYRVIDEKIYYFDTIHPSFTDLIPHTDAYRIITVNHDKDLTHFIDLVDQKREKQGKKFIDTQDEKRQDLVYITTFPWGTYTQLTHADELKQEDAIPRLAWGKWEIRDGKKWMPFSIMVHHGFIDGLHVGQLLMEIHEKLSLL
mgnify:CR=1 FL=1